jgi:hypothetical protein
MKLNKLHASDLSRGSLLCLTEVTHYVFIIDRYCLYHVGFCIAFYSS